MIDRSGFSHISFSLLAVTSAIVLSAACGGKVDSSSNGSSSGNSANGGASNGNSGDCSDQPAISCPVCPGQSTPTVTCVNGVRECTTTKCAVPTCDDEPKPNCKCGTPSCGVGGGWMCPGSCACPTDLSNLEGQPCNVEGLSCGGENCTNPCNFCNILQCEQGVWQNLEAFPAPCDDDGGLIAVDAGIGGH
ncbi:MAG: hypothetical protein ABI461_16085 [Polyangiaceae bacterium]